MRLLALLALVLGFAAPACAGAATRASRTTGVLRGTVTRGPVTPVCSDAQPCYEPAAGAKLVFLRRGRPVAHTRTRADGSYRIRLAAGRYAIRVRGTRRWKPGHVRVHRGRTTRVDISIDTGIR